MNDPTLSMMRLSPLPFCRLPILFLPLSLSLSLSLEWTPCASTSLHSAPHMMALHGVTANHADVKLVCRLRRCILRQSRRWPDYLENRNGTPDRCMQDDPRIVVQNSCKCDAVICQMQILHSRTAETGQMTCYSSPECSPQLTPALNNVCEHHLQQTACEASRRTPARTPGTSAEDIAPPGLQHQNKTHPSKRLS